MRGTIFVILGLFIFSCLIIISLFNFTTIPNEKANGFLRNYLEPSPVKLIDIKTAASIENICGVSRHKIFCSVRNPQWLVMIDKLSRTQDTIYFPVPLTEEVMNGHTYFVDSPWIYLHINNIPAIIYGKLDSGKINFVKIKSSIFTKSLQISPASFVIRTFDSLQGNQQVFAKANTSKGIIIKTNALIPEKKDDSGFSSDGMMHYDKSINRLIFLQYYQNRFFCLDTNLNAIYIGNTIDTTFNNTIKISMYNDGGINKLAPTNARTIINEKSAVSNGYLYVKSFLLADNDDRANANSKDPIDIYEIRTGKYIGSFYMHKGKHKQLKSFYINGDTIYALYSEQLSIYKHLLKPK